MKSQLKPAKLITIIADEAIKDKLISELKTVGMKGYTMSPATGEGLHSQNFSSWEGMNVRIESLLSEEKALKLLEILSQKYFDKYGVIAFLQDVQVLRKEKFD